MTRRTRRFEGGLGLGLEIGVPLALVGLLAVWSAGQDSYLYSPLTEVLDTFGEQWVVARVGSDVVPSLARMVAGLTIAVIGGVALGLALGRLPRVRQAVTPVIEFLRAIPPPALLGPAILVVGVGDSMKISIIALVCLWPILLNAIDGAAGLDPALEDTVRAYRIGRLDRAGRVVLPTAMPQIFAGIRLALSLALIMMVVSEMVASTNGIGFFVLQAQRRFAIAEMWSGIVLLGILGYLLNGIAILAERRVLRWHRGARASVPT